MQERGNHNLTNSSHSMRSAKTRQRLRHLLMVVVLFGTPTLFCLARPLRVLIRRNKPTLGRKDCDIQGDVIAPTIDPSDCPKRDLV